MSRPAVELTPGDEGQRAVDCQALCRSLGYPVPFRRNRDSLDFQEISVTSVMKALELAWYAGFVARGGGGDEPPEAA